MRLIETTRARMNTKARQWSRCKKYFQDRCAYCGLVPKKKLTKDHFIPKANGGRNGIDNIVPCCEKCNNLKQAKSPKSWCSSEQLVRVRQYKLDLGMGGNISSLYLKDKNANFNNRGNYAQLKKIIRQAKKVMVSCDSSIGETHYFKITKREMTKYINGNVCRKTNTVSFCFNYDGNVLRVG